MAVVVGEAEVLALAIPDGSELWSIPLGATAAGPPAVADDGRVLILGTDGVLRDHGPDADGSTVSFPACCTTPLIEQGRILVNRAGTTTAFDLDGEEVWRRLTGGNDSERFTRVAADARFVAIVIWSTPAAR
ncbi:MAG: PQQ-binding-like beta-propeller repeat protein [Actinobacteria bacterium]|nr:PQQ-binding-like beta-propeller repeat protein [Actinomycetota bacterium]NIS30998.1 PQQ-binding-like beta-propeller repeat protein [Actinomycetota bacterium]NIU66172.1 PQQ-binding-like beta-propeller repeat protein [Actinomycetota bacterium]NIX20466.1 PQQ-binding-like beta-propeller repeat protein [Actinomycetota bacterium]